MPRGANPYQNVPNGEGRNTPAEQESIYIGVNSYAVTQSPDSAQRGYTTAYATSLQSGGSTTGTPSSLRIGTREEPENDPNDKAYNRKRHRSFFRRHKVEETTLGWNVKQRRIPPPNVPEWNKTPAQERPTQNDSPDGYRFTRPWHIPRPIQQIFGTGAVAHFSMANHKRVTEINGMEPRGQLGVNTYRAQPRPWDEDITVRPEPVSGTEYASNVFGNTAQRGGRVFG